MIRVAINRHDNQTKPHILKPKIVYLPAPAIIVEYAINTKNHLSYKHSRAVFSKGYDDDG